jgi:hypothetical protein
MDTPLIGMQATKFGPLCLPDASAGAPGQVTGEYGHLTQQKRRFLLGKYEMFVLEPQRWKYVLRSPP